jgi:acyl transferase domain-containing protein
MRATRGILVLAGRGPGATAGRGALPAHHDWVEHTDELRAARGLQGLAALDAAPFDPAVHLQPIHALPLAWLSGMLDAERAALDHGIAAVVGNGIGFVTALTATGVIGFDDGFAYVQELGRLQQRPLPGGGHGGQVIYPRTDEAWRPDAALAASVAATMTGAGGNGRGSVYESVELGAFDVLAGDDAGVERLLRHLAPVRVGERRYPLRLPLQAPDHTPLAAHLVPELGARMARARWERPQVTLIDGTGRRWSPWSTDPAALAAYALGPFLTTPYRFATALRVGLREEAPDLLVVAGTGTGLAALCGQAIVAEGYRGIRTRADFERAQASDPVVLSIRR